MVCTLVISPQPRQCKDGLLDGSRHISILVLLRYLTVLYRGMLFRARRMGYGYIGDLLGSANHQPAKDQEYAMGRARDVQLYLVRLSRRIGDRCG